MTVRTAFAAHAPDDWLVADWPRARAHGFATSRHGPDSAWFDLGPARLDALEPDARARVLANRTSLQRYLPSAPVWLEQVHGTVVAAIDDASLEHARRDPPVADAAVTRLRGVPIAIRVADCLPVLFVDDDSTIVAAAHAGWRGLAAGVLESTVRAMDADPARIEAWFGPAIGPGAFEVGDDVRDAFVAGDPEASAHFVARAAGKWLADLPALARRRLARVGVTRVSGTSPCTFSASSRYFSWRRERTSARQAALVWLAP